MVQSDDARAADVFDFVDAYAAAQERGEDPPLAAWLARFPASQEAVAREWLALRRADEPDVANGRPSPQETLGADRIGPYRLLRELGRGGQGAVFLAEDTRIARRVALKVLASRFDTIRDDKLRRFRREAEIIARLDHPSLCTVYDADLAGETPYIAMRFVEGRTLADVIAEARGSSGAGDASGAVRLDDGHESTPVAVDVHLPPRTKLELDRVLLFFERAARALHAAHEAGVVHRDVKPGNVIVATDGKPVILDFGLARDEEGDDASQITASGEVFGTPAYMSPEQLDAPGDELDRRTDVWSLGVAIHEALTLHRPFEAASRPALYLAIQREPAPDPRARSPWLPEDVAVVLATALEKDRARRYATALDLAEDLRRIRQYEPIRARPAGVWVRFTRWVRRHPALAAATIGTIVSLSAGLAVALDLLAAEKRALTLKDEALDEKDAALSVALGKHLAQRSIELAAEDASAALHVGILAAERAPGYQTLSALYPALENCWLERTLSSESGSTLPGESGSQLPTALAVDPSGRRVAIAFEEGQHGVVYVFELSTGVRTLRFEPRRGAIDALDVAPAGDRLALATSDGTILGVRLDDGAVLRTTRVGRRVTRLAHAADGARILARTATGAALVVDAESGAIQAERAGPYVDARWITKERVLLAGVAGTEVADASLAEARDRARSAFAGTHAAADAAGHTFALVRDGGRIAVLDAELDVLAEVAAPEEPVLALAPAASGRRLAVRAGPREVTYLVDHDGTARELALPAGGKAQRLAWSPDGERLAVVTGGTSVLVFDGRTGGLLRAYALPKRQLDAAWTPDGARLVTTINGIANVWFARARPDVLSFAEHADAVNALNVAADGRRLVTASADGTARILPVRDGGPIVACRPAGSRAPLVDARLVAQGTRLVTADRAGWLRAFDASTGAELGATWVPGGVIHVLATHADATLVVAVSDSGEASTWDVARPELPRSPVPPGHGGARTTCAAFLPDGLRVALGTSSGSVDVRDARTLERAVELVFGLADGRAPAVSALAVSPRDDELAVVTDRVLRLRRIGAPDDSGGPHTVFFVRALAWDPTARRILALGRDSAPRSVRVVDRETGATTSLQNAHKGAITCAAFTADGAIVVTGAVDGSVHAWSARDGSPVVQRADLGAPVASVACVEGPAGPSIAVGLEDGGVRVFPFDPLSAARRRKPRDLAEWEVNRERALAAPLPFD